MSGEIAIVGMGGRFPGSPTLAAYWDTIREGRICAAERPASLRREGGHSGFRRRLHP